MKKTAALLATCGAVALLSAGANASVLVSATVGGAADGVTYVNFDGLSLGNAGGTSGAVTVSFTGDAQTVTGASSGVYAAPFLSNFDGTPFGDPSNGADATNYLTTGLGTVTIKLPGFEKYVGLLWGSVDTYNTLELYNGGTLVGTITGTDVTASANGDQGANGTFYVNIDSTLAFDSIVASSTQYAFEFDNVAYNPTHNPPPVPEPLTLSLFGIGLAGVAGWRRRRNQA
jgi:hypothetical protein